MRDQTTAKVRRLWGNLRNPRKIVLSIIALLLAVLWMGNALLSLLYRDAYTLETVRTWIPLMLSVYATWHLLKVAWKRPEEAIEWTPAERTFLCGGPFSRRELLRFRLTTVTTATIFKALMASVLLMPELPNWPVGFAGLFMGLAFIELLRMALEIFAAGASRRQFAWYRGIVFAGAGVLAVVLLFAAGGLFFGDPSQRATSTVQVFTRSVDTLIALMQMSFGRVLLAPFTLFGQVATASEILTIDFFRQFLSTAILVAATGWLVIWLDRHFLGATSRNEQAAYRDGIQTIDDNAADGPLTLNLPRVRHAAGIGPVFWRQWVTVWRHKGELAIALIAPVVLALLPLLQPLSHRATFLHVTAGLVFYSFLLLPPALKFDFRRDYERLATLKMLPLRPLTVVLGQLTSPVLIATAFQLLMLLITVIARPVSPAFFLIAALILIPLNVLIFSIENLIFLLAPHRLKQEGFEVFLRTMLVFTAKAIFFAIGLAFFFLWSAAAAGLAGNIEGLFGITIDSGVVFLAGSWVAIGGAACCIIDQIARVFNRIDPADDLG